MGCLYKLTSPSGKSYIGISAKSLKARWAKHVEHACGKRTAGALYAALRKYGPDTFTREVLTTSEDWDELCRLEIAAIASHGTFAPHGYNLTVGGEGVLGPRSEQAKAAITAAQRKRFERPEERERMREIAKRAAESPSPKRLASYHARRKPKAPRRLMTAEEKSARIRAGLSNPDVRAQMSARAQERCASPEWRRQMSASQTGKKKGPCSDLRKQRIADARRREWADPEIRAKRLAAFAKAREAKTRASMQA